MSISLIGAFAESRYRIRALYSGVGSYLLSDFTIARADGGPNDVAPASIFNPDFGQFVISTNEPMRPQLVYKLTYLSSQTFEFSFQPPPALDPQVTPVDEDLEAEAFGIDFDWLFSEPTGTGDCPQLSGLPCYQNDLASAAVLDTGELVHKPDDGVGLLNHINGPEGDIEEGEIAGKLEAQFKRDPRTSKASVDVTLDAVGNVNYNARVVPVATGIQTTVANT